MSGATERGIFVDAGTSPTLIGNSVCGSEMNLIIHEKANPVLEDNEICEDTPAATTD